MHVYALCHATVTLTLPAGVASPLQQVSQGQLIAVVESGLQLDELQQNDDRLLHAVLVHDRVVRELFQQATVLPFRFTAFPSLDDLLTDLQTNQAGYLDTLARLDGKAELTLKFLPQNIPADPIATDLKGKDYFLAKKRHHQEQQQQRNLQAQELNQLLEAIAHQYPLSVQPDSHQAHILVRREEVSQFQEWLTQSMNHVTQWDYIVGEPLPPFHFV